MKPQQVFDKVITHLKTQGEAAFDEETDGCCYRLIKNGKTLMCAAGCLIPDDKYNPDFECLTITHLRDEGLDVPVITENISLVQKLQNFHDGLFKMYGFDHPESRAYLVAIAKQEKISLDILN